MTVANILWSGLSWQWQELLVHWGGTIARLIVILVLAAIVLKLGNRVINRAFEESAKRAVAESKAETFSGMLKNVWRYVVIFVALMIVLREFEVDLTPAIAGAGILGLAVGFGAQSLVKDVITGLFIVLEDQFTVGDYVSAGNCSGIVEQIGLRTTKIADFGGQTHVVPNSMITLVTNYSRGPQRSLVDVSVAYEEDVSRVLHVLKELCEEIKENYPQLTEGPNVVGVVALGDSDVVIRVVAMAEPMSQWHVERELLRSIKLRFDREGIEIPYPRRVIYPRHEGREEQALLSEAKEGRSGEWEEEQS